MVAIALPDYPGPAGATPFYVDFGGEQLPFMGGPGDRVNRGGMRMGLRITMPPLVGDVGRQFASRLVRGKTSRVSFEWPQLDLDPGSPPAPRISVNGSGTAIQIEGLGAGYAFREGQFFTVIHAGFRYIHFATGMAVANGAGVALVSFWPPSRVTFSAADVVEISTPRIEGFVSPGDEISWDMAVEHTLAISFSVAESR